MPVAFSASRLSSCWAKLKKNMLEMECAMTHQHSNTDWAQKYRPACLEDMVLPATWKRALIQQRDQQQGLSLLLHGPAGSGKTTAGLLINPEHTHKINCSVQNGIEMVRTLVEMTKRRYLFGELRVVLLDEADYLTKEAQAGLRAAMEDHSSENMYVFTANFVSNLIAPIQSRLMPLDFSSLSGDMALRDEMVERVTHILELEKVEATKSQVKAVVRDHFPDMRQVLKKLQFQFGLLAT